MALKDNTWAVNYIGLFESVYDTSGCNEDDYDDYLTACRTIEYKPLMAIQTHFEDESNRID